MNIFMLRGLARESRHWGAFLELMRKEYGESKVHTPDIPGAGAYANITSPKSFDDMIHFIRDKYRKELTQGPNALLAVSLGGMVAKRWAELYPDEIDKLVLINTSYRGINPSHHRLRPWAMKQFLRIAALPTIKQKEKAILDLVINDKSLKEDLLSQWIEIQKSAPIQMKSALNQLTAALLFVPNKASPKCDTMLLASVKDRLCSHECSRKIHKLWPESELHLHPSAGHELTAEDPKWALKKVKQFF